MTDQEWVRQCDMARVRRARFVARPGRLPLHEDEDQDQEGEDRDHEMEDEDREPRKGEEKEEVWEVAEPPVALPKSTNYLIIY